MRSARLVWAYWQRRCTVLPLRAPLVEPAPVEQPETLSCDTPACQTALAEAANAAGMPHVASFALERAFILANDAPTLEAWLDALLVSGQLRRLERDHQFVIHRLDIASDRSVSYPITTSVAPRLLALLDRGTSILFVEGTTIRRWSEGSIASTETGISSSATVTTTLDGHTLFVGYEDRLEIRGSAPARVIQQLAGHSSLMTTQRYMHLSPGATEAAIALLEAPPPRRVGADHDIGSASGDPLETAGDHSPSIP